MADLEIGKSEVDHSNVVIILGYTDSSHSISHCFSNELHILLSQRTSSCYVIEDPFYNPTYSYCNLLVCYFFICPLKEHFMEASSFG